MEAPDGIEPVVGWRSWRVRDGARGLELLSTSRDVLWPPGRSLEAACALPDHRAPALPCSCGVYAASDPEPALASLPPSLRAARIVTPSILGYDRVLAVGLVALWGELVVCDWGWRGRYAYPRALFLPRRVVHYRRRHGRVEVLDSEGLAEELARSYGVVARVCESLRSPALAAAAARLAGETA